MRAWWGLWCVHRIVFSYTLRCPRPPSRSGTASIAGLTGARGRTHLICINARRRNPPTLHILSTSARSDAAATRRPFAARRVQTAGIARTSQQRLDHGRKNRRQYRHPGHRQPELVVSHLPRDPRSRRHRYFQALRGQRPLHLRSRLHLDRELRIEDHLHRRRRGGPALSRLSDRAAGRARRLRGDLLPAASRRAADRRAEGRVPAERDAPHDGARAGRAVLPGLPPRRPSHGGHGGQRRRALGVLSRPERHHRSDPAHDGVGPPDRQDADARRHGLQILDRPAVHLSAQRPRLCVELPAHVLRGPVRGLQGQSGAGARHGPHLHPACRPRAERVDLDGAGRRLLRRRPVRLHRRRRRSA